MDDKLLKQLDKLKNVVDELHSERLNVKSKKELKKRDEWWEKWANQRFGHKMKMFNMVYTMTTITYVVVLIIIISQVIDGVRLPEDWTGYLIFEWLIFEDLETGKLALIITGFLAELLLLPKIILSGLFSDKEDFS